MTEDYGEGGKQVIQTQGTDLTMPDIFLVFFWHLWHCTEWWMVIPGGCCPWGSRVMTALCSTLSPSTITLRWSLAPLTPLGSVTPLLEISTLRYDMIPSQISLFWLNVFILRDSFFWKLYLVKHHLKNFGNLFFTLEIPKRRKFSSKFTNLNSPK